MGVTSPVGRQPTVLKWREIRGTGDAAMRIKLGNWLTPLIYIYYLNGLTPLQVLSSFN